MKLDWSTRLKKSHTSIVLALVGVSVVLTLYDWMHMRKMSEHLGEVSWVGMSLLVTEAFFVIGALLMALSAGESFIDLKRLHHVPKRLAEARRNAKSLAKQILTNRLFAVGFWLNFVGAVGSSVVLVVAVLLLAPMTGLGIIFILIIDLIATFIWRIPLEAARRKARRNDRHNSPTSNS